MTIVVSNEIECSELSGTNWSRRTKGSGILSHRGGGIGGGGPIILGFFGRPTFHWCRGASNLLRSSRRRCTTCVFVFLSDPPLFVLVELSSSFEHIFRGMNDYRSGSCHLQRLKTCIFGKGLLKFNERSVAVTRRVFLSLTKMDVRQFHGSRARESRCGLSIPAALV